jgi:hypothetical protein
MAFNASSQIYVNQELEGWPENRERALAAPAVLSRGEHGVIAVPDLGGPCASKEARPPQWCRLTPSSTQRRKGVLVKKALDTDMAALAGTVTNALFNVFCHYIDSAGTLTTSMGQQATTLGGVAFPPTTDGLAMIGFTIINPTGTGDFVGGTTVLDDATVVPNAVFVNTQGAFDPNYLFSY